MEQGLCTILALAGAGLRAPHYQDVLEKRPGFAWLEVHSENYFGEGGNPLTILEKIRVDYPISLHGVGLSLGSADELNWSHLKKLKDLYQRITPCLVSEHLSWSSINGQYFHDLLPLPYTEESLNHLCQRIVQIQDFLQRQILIENIASYISFKHSTIPEWEFISCLAQRTQCGILLDINNIYVSATNLGFNAENFLRGIAPQYIQEMHLAGFTTTTINAQPVLVDSHSVKVDTAVWGLYKKAIKQLGRKPTIIEWDEQLPSLDVLYQEASHAEALLREQT